MTDARSASTPSRSAQRVEIFGAPVVTLELASDKPSAMIAARLEDVAPDGASTLVTYGLLNLTHRDGHEHPQALEPGRTYRVAIVLNDIAQAFPAGHRIRLALATSHWPIAWPSPELATLSLSADGSNLSLPVREPSPADAALSPFPPAEEAEGEPHVIAKLAGRNRTITEDPMTGEMTVTVHRERASYHLPAIDLAFEADAEEHYRIREGEPWRPPPMRAPPGGFRAAIGASALKPIPVSGAPPAASRSAHRLRRMRARRAWRAATGS